MSMSTDTNLDSLPPTDTDDDEDLSTLDRGDNVEADDESEGEEADKQSRDDKGRFAKKDDKKVEEESEAEEAEEESEEEEEEEDEADDEADGKGKGKDKLDNAAIRLNKMREQRDRERQAREALEARLAELEKSSKKEPEEAKDPIAEINTELDGLYEQVEEARADNNLKEAARLQRLIDSKREQITEIKAERIASKTTTVAAENARYDAMLDSYETLIPAINPTSDDFDKEAVRALEFHVNAYEKMGMQPTKALKMAVGLLFGDPTKQVEKAKPEDDKKPAPPKKKVDAQKAIDTQKRQPPDSSDRGVNKDDPSIKPTALSEEDFEKLPESKKAQLRGDFG